MSALLSSTRKPKAEPQLTPDQAAYIHHCRESLVQRGMQTIRITEQVDDQGQRKAHTQTPCWQRVERMPTYKHLYKRLLMEVSSPAEKGS